VRLDSFEFAALDAEDTPNIVSLSRD